MTLYKELGEAFKLKRQEGESFTDFAIRASTRVNKCTDAEWKQLSAELQTWNNDVMQLREENAALDKDAEPAEFPELDGFPADEEETVVDEDGVVQEEDGEEDGAEENTAAEADEGVDESAEGEQDAVAEDDPPQRQRGKPNKQEKKMPTRAVTAEKDKAPPKAAKKAVEKPAKKAANGSGKRTKLDPEATIKILSKENPHREGSARFKRWSKYRDGMTVAAALKAGFNAGDLQHSVADGNIKIV
jgi:hypothetical protein